MALTLFISVVNTGFAVFAASSPYIDDEGYYHRIVDGVDTAFDTDYEKVVNSVRTAFKNRESRLEFKFATSDSALLIHITTLRITAVRLLRSFGNGFSATRLQPKLSARKMQVTATISLKPSSVSAHTEILLISVVETLRPMATSVIIPSILKRRE